MMKKLLKISLVAALFFAGSQLVTAQSLSKDQNRPEVIAKAEVAKIDKALDLDGDQERALFRAITGKIVNYRKLVEGQDAKDPVVIKNKEKIDAGFNAAVKKAIGEKNYKAWLVMRKQ